MNIYEIQHGYEDGRRVVYVQLSNSKKKARLYERDFNELISIGAGLPWKLLQGIVVVRNNGRNVSVARLIADADKGQNIIFKDDNPANLVIGNLLKTPGNAKFRARDQIVKSYKHNAPELKYTPIYLREGFNLQ